MRLFDALHLTSAPVIDENGNMLVVSRSARTGTQVYTGASVGRPEMQWAVGYRPADEVFAQDSLDSYTAIPVTIDHPEQFVDADTWKEVAVGETDGAIKDGDFIRVPFTVRHAKAIKTIRDGKSAISMGYSADLDWTAGITDSGEKYDFIMRNLRMNHLSIVSEARGGPQLRIGDENSTPRKKEYSVKKLDFGGVTVSIDDHDAVASGFEKMKAELADAKSSADTANKALADVEAKHATALADAEAKVATQEAEIASLKQAVIDAKVTPEQMREAAKAYALVTDAAAKMGFTVTDAMSEAEIKKGAVLARLGDSYKDKSEAFFDAAFEIESGKLKDAAPVIQDAFQQARSNAKPIDFADAATKAREARAEMIANFNKRDRANAE